MTGVDLVAAFFCETSGFIKFFVLTSPVRHHPCPIVEAFDVTIGLEIHVQLKTNSKIFSRSESRYGAEPNTLTDPVVLGLPGTLPVLNREAVNQCIRLGLMLGCDIAKRCKWDRKNYFYPDNPKNYQITQYDEPLCLGGRVEIELVDYERSRAGEHRYVDITRIHLEEDPGKLNHLANSSWIDFNRCGVPLAEIVTEPCMTSADEAVAFLNALRLLATYAGVSDCDMEKGQLRCDANVSLKPRGQSRLGTRTETKNLNSVSNVKAAIEAEIQRQSRILLAGGSIDQETRRWDADRNESFTLRSKEDAHDYRYFPDPDLMPVEISPETVDLYRSQMPEQPFDRQRRYIDLLGLPWSTASVLVSERAIADWFEQALESADDPKLARPIANVVSNNLLSALASNSGEGGSRCPIRETRFSPADLADFVKLYESGAVIKDVALKQIFPVMFETGKPPRVLAEELNLLADEDSDQLEAVCRKVVGDPKFAKAIQQFTDGNEKALNALMGPVMKATAGKANPPKVLETLRNLIQG